MATAQAIYDSQRLLTTQQFYQWKGILFSYQWWFLLLILVGSWVVWWKLVRKELVFQVFAYALLVVIIGTTLDIYGVKLGLWAYPIKTFYLNPGLLAGDFSLPPVVKSLVYQAYPDWKRYITAQLIVAAILAFMAEPLLVWVGIYQMYRWSYLSSFLVYVPVAIIVKWLVDGIKRKALAKPFKSSPGPS